MNEDRRTDGPTAGDASGEAAVVDRFGAWADVLDRAFVRLEPVAFGRAPFHGGVRRVRLDGGIAIARVDAGAHAHAHLPDTDARRCAAAFGISTRAVHRAFEMLGRTFTATVTAHRLARAARLLADSDADITRIAHACGFGDGSYLARRFRARHGVSPSAWRRLRKGERTDG